MTQKSLIKMQISPIKNPNFEKPSRDPSNKTIVKILEKKFFLISLKKKLVPRMLSHRVNVRISKFWRKSKETKRKIFRKIYQGHIRIWFRSKKNSKISHACVPLRNSKIRIRNCFSTDPRIRIRIQITKRYGFWTLS